MPAMQTLHRTPLIFVALVIPALLLLAVVPAGCSPGVTLVGTYHIEQEGYGFGEGAEKITLDLNADKTFKVQAGPKVTLLDGTWEAKDGKLKFSEEQGAMKMNYRIDGTKLVPLENDGKDVPGWQWAR
jgi:hypothetical protein